MRRRPDESTSARAVIVSSLFLVLFTTALIVGGHAAIDPLLRMATTARNADALGDIVYPMPDGHYCRHRILDNATLTISEGNIEPCPGTSGGGFRRTGNGFSWNDR